MRLILGHELEKIREKISCKQFGDDHYGEWGILTLNQRRTILRMIETIRVLDKMVENAKKDELGLFHDESKVPKWVVLCKDCQFSIGDVENTVFLCNHPHGVYLPRQDDFCSLGIDRGGAE